MARSCRTLRRHPGPARRVDDSGDLRRASIRRVREEPTITTVRISACSGRASASVVMAKRSSSRVTLRAKTMTVSGPHSSRRISRGAGELPGARAGGGVVEGHGEIAARGMAQAFLDEFPGFEIIRTG